jgi:hypothetical protein
VSCHPLRDRGGPPVKQNGLKCHAGSLWASSAESDFYFSNPEKSADFAGLVFTEKGRGGSLHFQTRIFYKPEILYRPICRLVSIYKR